MSARVTRFALLATGARRLSLTVRGVRVLVEPCDGDEQAAAESLAAQIAALGPADAEADDIAPSQRTEGT